MTYCAYMTGLVALLCNKILTPPVCYETKDDILADQGISILEDLVHAAKPQCQPKLYELRDVVQELHICSSIISSSSPAVLEGSG